MSACSGLSGKKGSGAELQIYHRTLTETGLKSHFLRMQDDVLVVQVVGELIRME